MKNKGIGLITEVLADTAKDLIKGDEKSKSLGLMISEISRMFENDPRELQRVFVLVDEEKKELEKISALTYNLTRDFIPKGLDKDGFIKFRDLFSVMMDNPEKIADAIGMTTRTIYTTGVFLYYLFLSLFDDVMFSKIKSYFNI